MAHAAFDRAFDQRAGIDRVVAVVAERIAHRIRHHDGSGEVDDGVDAVVADDARHQRLVAGFADDQRHAGGDGPVEAGGEVVEHDDSLAGVDQLMNHVAADIATAARDQDCHVGQSISVANTGRRRLNCKVGECHAVAPESDVI